MLVPWVRTGEANTHIHIPSWENQRGAFNYCSPQSAPELTWTSRIILGNRGWNSLIIRHRRFCVLHGGTADEKEQLNFLCTCSGPGKETCTHNWCPCKFAFPSAHLALTKVALILIDMFTSIQPICYAWPESAGNVVECWFGRRVQPIFFFKKEVFPYFYLSMYFLTIIFTFF